MSLSSRMFYFPSQLDLCLFPPFLPHSLLVLQDDVQKKQEWERRRVLCLTVRAMLADGAVRPPLSGSSWTLWC